MLQTVPSTSLPSDSNKIKPQVTWTGLARVKRRPPLPNAAAGGGARVPRRLGFLVAACQPLVFARAPGATSWYHEAGSGFRGERKFPTGGRFSFKAFLWQELSVR